MADPTQCGSCSGGGLIGTDAHDEDCMWRHVPAAPTDAEELERKLTAVQEVMKVLEWSAEVDATQTGQETGEAAALLAGRAIAYNAASQMIRKALR